MEQDPFREGFEAASRGDEYSANPYSSRRQHSHYFEWANGWNRADFARALQSLPAHVRESFNRADA